MISTTTPSKSVFRSKTLWGAVLTLIAAVAPIAAKEYEAFQQTGKITPTGVSNIVVISATTALTILGRVEATERIHTPKGFPGMDKPES